MLLREARQHAAGLQGDKQGLEGMQRRLRRALIKVTLPAFVASAKKRKENEIKCVQLKVN